MGVEQHEPRVVNMLLDFVYSYTSGVLSDAAAYAEQVRTRSRQQRLFTLLCCIFPASA
jgi:hypothetical protein